MGENGDLREAKCDQEGRVVVDEHTRAAILRGGGYYQPQGSKWYFPQAYRYHEHGKLLLMAPGYNRSAAVGFRCVADAE